MKLRDYQIECLEIIDKLDEGAYLIQMATGLGKTVTFANIPRKGRVLILSHREELVRQPLKYFKCSTGVEMAKERSNGEEVVSASVMSMVRRLDSFEPDEFDMIIVDEAHHAAAKTYKKILEYFKPRLTLGFTATPNRADSVRLDKVFSDIIFKRDLKWGIQNGYLCDIFCKRAHIGYDLSKVHTRNGDYAPGELEEAMDGTADAVAQVYREHAVGATLIFAVSVNQCNEIAGRIPGAVVVTGNTPNRSEIIKAFTERKIPCIVNCMVFTEGTDMPLVETVIIARPTQSESLYTQMVGRGLRLYEGKEKLNLIDCVGVTGRASLCTAPTLLGLDIKNIPDKKKAEIEGDLFELPEKAIRASDCPESWVRNIEIIDLWAKEQKYNTHNVNWFKMPNGDMLCSLPDRKNIRILCPDELGRTVFNGEMIDMQQAFDNAYLYLSEHCEECRAIWDLNIAKKWGRNPATDRQKEIIKKRFKEFETDSLTKLEAAQILNRVYGGHR